MLILQFSRSFGVIQTTFLVSRDICTKFRSITYCCPQAERSGPWTSCLGVLDGFSSQPLIMQCRLCCLFQQVISQKKSHFAKFPYVPYIQTTKFPKIHYSNFYSSDLIQSHSNFVRTLVAICWSFVNIALHLLFHF